MPGIYNKNTWINTVYSGSTLYESVYLGNLKILERTPQDKYKITVKASNDANIRLTTFNTNDIVTNTSSASINAAPGDKVFYKITKDGYNTIYSWIDVNGNKTINNTLTENCFKYTIETPEVGEAPDEAYALYFKVMEFIDYQWQVQFDGYIDWDDVKNITPLKITGGYGSGDLDSIKDTVWCYDSINVSTKDWKTAYPEGVPYYSEKECINLAGYYTGDTGGYISFDYRTVNKRKTVGWLKNGYSEVFRYKLPFQLNDTSYQQSGGTLTINWGDSTSSTITGELTDEKLTHIYTVPGQYQITITSSNNKMPLISFYEEDPNQHTINIISVDTPLLNFTNRNPDIDNLFRNCEKLNSICDQAFSNITDINHMYRAFYNCISLSSLPKGILNIENCSDYTETFRYTTNLENSEFFNPEILKNTNKTCKFSKCFEKLDYANRKTGKIQPLWEIPFKKKPITNKAYEGNHEDSASNWFDVPESWGGPTNVKVKVTCPTTKAVSILINDIAKNPTEMLSGKRFTYKIIPDNPIKFITYDGLDYVKGAKESSESNSHSYSYSGSYSGSYDDSSSGSGEIHKDITYNVRQKVRRNYDFGIFPETDPSNVLKVCKVNNDLFAIMPKREETNTWKVVQDGALYNPIYKYDAYRRRWYAAENIEKDPNLVSGYFSFCAGIFKIGNKYFTILKNTDIYSSLDGYVWNKEINTSGISQYNTESTYPEYLTSNNSTIAIIKLHNGTLLYTEDGISYYSCSGIANSTNALTYMTNKFWTTNGQNLYKSSDGKTFTFVCTFPTDKDFLTYTGGKYYALKLNSANTMFMYSTDGGSWHEGDYDYGAPIFYYGEKYISPWEWDAVEVSDDGIYWGMCYQNRGSIDNEYKEMLQLDDGVVLSGDYGKVRMYNLDVYTYDEE